MVDEAQDLSPIQWKMYDILKKNSKHIILAGDDDQAIYGWAGADVARFQSEPAKDIILQQSLQNSKSCTRYSMVELLQIRRLY